LLKFHFCSRTRTCFNLTFFRNSTTIIENTIKSKEDFSGNVENTDTLPIDAETSSVFVKDLSDECNDKAVQVSEDDFRQFTNLPNIIGKSGRFHYCMSKRLLDFHLPLFHYISCHGHSVS
jgi:hypothetical protein